MTIETRLQLTIGFILQAPTSTEDQLIAFLVSQGDTIEEATAALPLYLGMMVQFGFIETATYETMRDWGNARTIEQITVATGTMLVKYNELKALEAIVTDLTERKAVLESDILEAENHVPTQQELEACWIENNHDQAKQVELDGIDTELARYGNNI
jgi:hypothetical protein